ncbi:hypothetical protein CRUP_020675 [Coryphaenoides rupestris]|nr:hypothetical protein CRUP_020675 [Coryphaenoides rupestris]
MVMMVMMVMMMMMMIVNVLVQDEEEADMYEVPPCERPVIKVPPKPMELDFIYLGRSAEASRSAPETSCPAPQTTGPTPETECSAAETPETSCPPPETSPFTTDKTDPTHAACRRRTHQAHQTDSDGQSFAPEVDRKEKPGKKGALKKMPPPPIHATPLPAAPQQVEEDVYIDPNEEQGDSDDVYLQPTAACPPPSRGPMRLPPPLSPAVAPPVPMSMMKPPVPRALSNSLLPSVSEMKAAPDGKRTMFSPPSAVKPSYLASNKDSQSRPLSPPMDDKWFAGDCKRKRAEELLLRINKDGAFLVRRSSSQDPRQPYTLAVLYSQKVYNIPIRFSFSSLQDIILHHKNNQLLLIDSMSQAMHKTYLVHPARP